MTVYEADGSIVIVDAGLAFPRDEHLGVDLVLPDFSYLVERAEMIRGVVLTHGHEDHVGSLPYLMREVRIPVVVATRLTLGLIKSKLDEHGLAREAELREVAPGDDPFNLGPFRIEFIRMAHSIPDAAAVVLETPGGRVVHTGDYKIDHTPVDGQRTDVGKLASVGNQGVDLLLGDSTNAERAGVTQSERVVGEAFRQIFPSRTGRILISSFASNVHRMQQAADVGIECGRKVAFVGRSMRKNANIARNLGYMNVPEEAILRPQDLAELPPGEQLILCTGSQGEPMSAMTRIAYNDHPAVRVEAGDTVIISAKPIPGNELRVHDAINRLARSGAEVLHEDNAPVHVSGHGRAEELRTIIALLRPRAVMPVHGEFRMLAAHAQLARESGLAEENIVLAENGTVVELKDGVARVVDHVQAGMTFVDGLGVGDVHDVALRDRRRRHPCRLERRGRPHGAAGADRARLRRRRRAAPGRVARRGAARARAAPSGRRHRDQAPPGASARRARRHRVPPHAQAADDPACAGGGLMAHHRLRYVPTWADVLEECATEQATALRLIAQLGACEASALAFCRLLEQWARGEPKPATPGGRQAAIRRAAERVETALSGLQDPLDRYLLELEADALEGRSWYGGPGVAELLDWGPILDRAGVRVPADRVAQAYLELAVLVRALEGLSDAARIELVPAPSSLWAGLFDLRENLLGGALDDVRVLTVT